MGERLVAEASSIEELRAQVPDIELSPGSRGTIELRGFGLGIAGDMPGAEEVWRRTFNSKGLQVIDVYGEGLSTAFVKWSFPASAAQGQTASMAVGPIAVGVIIGVAVLALLALGWAIKQVRLLVETPAGAAMSIGLLLIGGVVLLAFLAQRKKATS